MARGLQGDRSAVAKTTTDSGVSGYCLESLAISLAANVACAQIVIRQKKYVELTTLENILDLVVLNTSTGF